MHILDVFKTVSSKIKSLSRIRNALDEKQNMLLKFFILSLLYNM